MVARRLVASVSLLTLAMSVLAANAGSCSAQAQSVPNLSGTWELIEFNGSKKSKQPPDKFPGLTLVISQEGSEIRITKKRTKRGIQTVQDYSYYTDGRGEKNDGRIEVWGEDVHGLDSVSGWQKNRLVTQYDRNVTLQTGSKTTTGPRPGPGEYSIVNSSVSGTDEWRLGRDGLTLVMTTAIVFINSPSTTGGLSDPRLENPGRDGQAAYADFGKTKLVFRKI